MRDRLAALETFLSNAGWADAHRVCVAGDASNRSYDRLTHENGDTRILMDAPPEKDEDVRPFVHIAKHLSDGGLSAPAIYAEDAENGFLLIEDLGDDLYARILETEPSRERELYHLATDVLVTLHQLPCPDLPRYDAEVMTELAALAFDWYLPGTTNSGNETAKQNFKDAIRTVLTRTEEIDPVLIQRDYHAENLLWLPNREGVARVGLLDFQDAMLGHPAYDLVSVLQDARRDVSGDIEEAMVHRYIQASNFDEDAFRVAYAALGLQRNLRILGVFARLCIRDGKPHYVDLIPRVWAHILTNLSHPQINPLRDKVLPCLPTPTPETLDHLRAKCANAPLQS